MPLKLATWDAISQATYTQVIGTPPAQLKPAETADRYLPRTRDDAIALAFKEPPTVMAASFDVDVASTTIHVAESSLLPTVTLQGSASHSSEADPTISTLRSDQASVVGQINAPIYDGGTAASQTRQAKELAAQSRLVLDQFAIRRALRLSAPGLRMKAPRLRWRHRNPKCVPLESHCRACRMKRRAASAPQSTC